MIISKWCHLICKQRSLRASGPILKILKLKTLALSKTSVCLPLCVTIMPAILQQKTAAITIETILQIAVFIIIYSRAAPQHRPETTIEWAISTEIAWAVRTCSSWPKIIMSWFPVRAIHLSLLVAISKIMITLRNRASNSKKRRNLI